MGHSRGWFPWPWRPRDITLTPDELAHQFGWQVLATQSVVPSQFDLPVPDAGQIRDLITGPYAAFAAAVYLYVVDGIAGLPGLGEPLTDTVRNTETGAPEQAATTEYASARGLELPPAWESLAFQVTAVQIPNLTEIIRSAGGAQRITSAPGAPNIRCVGDYLLTAELLPEVPMIAEFDLFAVVGQLNGLTELATSLTGRKSMFDGLDDNWGNRN